MHLRKRFVGGVATLAMLVGVGAVEAAPESRDDGHPQPVLVVAGDEAAAGAAVVRAGGSVEASLPLTGAVTARLSPVVAARVDGVPGVTVVPDETLEVAADAFAASSAHVQAINPGADWTSSAGAGIGVAVIDTGVADVPGLAGRVVHGPDLSGEGDGVDRFGHGTFMAGIIAGDGSFSPPEERYHGVAPGAHIVSLKVAGRNGETTLSKVIEAIGWVVVNRAEHDIRVLNLSFGVVTPVAPAADPLSAAVEAAWAAGITVVAASGNEGTGTVTSPGRDPWVITVGATDTGGTPETHDDIVPSWSGSGKVVGVNKPELVAPGVGVISLRAPGSVVDESYPQARVGDAYMRGSGTSMAAAVTSGAAAVLAAHHPAATPDDIKGALVSAGDPVQGTTALALDLAGADVAEAQPSWWQRHPIAFNNLDGNLEGGMPWSVGRWAVGRWAGGTSPSETWSVGRWAAGRWAGGEWTVGRWAVGRWAVGRWADETWAAGRWAAGRWAAGRWAAGRWAHAGWVAAMWGDDGTP
jgi:serine protease AprX